MNSEVLIIKKVRSDRMGSFGMYFLGFLFSIVGFFYFWPLFILGILFFIGAEISHYVTNYFILNIGVEEEYKFFSTSKKYIDFSKIYNIKVYQSFFDNIFNIGSVSFEVPGESGEEIVFRHVRNPYKIQELVREYID